MTKIWVGRTMLNEELEVASSEKKLKIRHDLSGKWNRKQLKRILYLTQASTGN